MRRRVLIIKDGELPMDEFHVMFKANKESKVKRKYKEILDNLNRYKHLTESVRHNNDELESHVYAVLVSGLYTNLNIMMTPFEHTNIETAVLVYDIYSWFNKEIKLDGMERYKKSLCIKSSDKFSDEFIYSVCRNYMPEELARNFVYRVDDFYRTSYVYLMIAIKAFRAFYMI